VGENLSIADISVYAYSHRAEDCGFHLADYRRSAPGSVACGTPSARTTRYIRTALIHIPAPETDRTSSRNAPLAGHAVLAPAPTMRCPGRRPRRPPGPPLSGSGRSLSCTTQRSAKTEIVVVGIGVCVDTRVARYTHVDVVEIREGWRLVVAGVSQMTAGAVAFQRIFEQRRAPLFLLRQFDVASQVGVVAAVVGIELGRFLLESLQRARDASKARCGLSKMWLPNAARNCAA